MFELLISSAALTDSLTTIIVIGLLFLTLVPLLIKWLWNSTLPELFGLKTIRHFDGIESTIPQSITHTESWFYGFGGSND